MSQKFENIFKEALQNQEVPYDAAAWSAMSTKLDKAMPVAGKKPFNPWAAVIITVALVGGASVWYFASNNNKPTEKISRSTQTEINNAANKKSNVASNSNIDNPDENQSSASSSSSINSDLSANDGNSNTTDSKKSNGNNPFNKDLKKIEDQSWSVTPPNKVYKTKVYPPAPLTPKVNDDLIKISNTCQFMDKKITNRSDARITIEFPSGFEVMIDPRTTKNVDFSEFGTYKVSNSAKKENTFVVFENKAIDFAIDHENIYNNGIPSTEVKTMNAAPNSNIQWTSKQVNQSRSGNKAEFNFFKDGDYTISVTSTNKQGCSTVATKNVTINNDYNLLAATAFKPQDLDPRVNTFMPTALTERNTAFSMIVIDPKDGGVIFETTDATAGWNGIDKRTGKPAIHGSNYIWKVSINNPLPGEAASYKGIVTVIID